MEITELRSLLNSISLKNLYNLSLSISFSPNSSIFLSTGLSFFSVTNFLLIIALSLFSISVSLLLFCFISYALSNNLSNVPYLLINSAAVLTPIPGTPGTLSLLSPANAWTSITLLGSTPNLLIISFEFINLFFIGSNIRIFFL